jgi:cytoskeletal protein RodZ
MHRPTPQPTLSSPWTTARLWANRFFRPLYLSITSGLFGLLVGLLGLALFGTVQAQSFYKWVDSKGSTHYTTTAPPQNAKKIGKVSTYKDSSSTNPEPNSSAPSLSTPVDNSSTSTPAAPLAPPVEHPRPAPSEPNAQPTIQPKSQQRSLL